MSSTTTLPRLLARNAAQWPRRPAWRHKRLGIWQTQTWSAFAERTRQIAFGLAADGFGRFDRLAVLGDNHPDLYAALLAAQWLGGIGVPLDPDASDGRLSEILESAAVSVLVTDTIEQAERLKALAGGLAMLRSTYFADANGLQRHDRWKDQSLGAAAEAGRALAEHEPSRLEQAMAHSTAQDLALLIYPVGDPVATHILSLSHAQLISAAEAIIVEDPVHPDDQALCYLPMASYEDALYSLTLGLLGGFACNCPETPDSVLRDLREIGPTILYAPPAACVALTQSIAAKAEATVGLKRRSFAFFQRQALQAEALREQGRALPTGLSLLCRIGEAAVYAPVRDQLGLNRTRWVRAGAPVPAESGRLLRALGIALRSRSGWIPEPASVPDAHETQHA